MAARLDLVQRHCEDARLDEQPSSELEVRECELPDIAPAARDVINAWLDARGAARFNAGEREFELTWTEPAPLRMQVGLQLQFGSHSVLLALDGFAAIDPLLIGEPFALLPEALRDLTLQHVFGSFLLPLPACIADAADLRAVHWRTQTWPAPCTFDCMLGFTLRRLPERLESQGIIAAAEPDGLRWLHERLPVADAAAHACADLPVPLTIALGSTCVDTAALRDLGAGDVVWIETARPSRAGLLAQLLTPAGNPGWTCRLRRESLHIVAASGAVTQGDRAYWRAPMMKADGSSLEVPVTFDLGELQVPLQQLEQLQPGRLFELAQQAGEAKVYLRVSGKLVAEGRMVTIGKRIGVRIARVRMEPTSNA